MSTVVRLNTDTLERQVRSLYSVIGKVRALRHPLHLQLGTSYRQKVTKPAFSMSVM